MTDRPAETFADDAGRYRLEERLATGGMGEVWRATDTSLGREVAVKLLKQEYADDPSFRARFETEAQHAGALHHPNIATVYDYGAGEDGRPYLVMELVDGQPLSALIRPDTPMDPVAVRELLAQAADGLAAAHAAGIVHRDVKPANLLVTPDRRVKITDFGIARAAEGMGLTQTGEVMGTPQYLSPEQAQGQTATAASDVYALGVVAFECLAGHRPYVADTAVATALMHLREPVPDLPDDVPADLAAVVRRSMAKLPQDRYADGAALAAALRDPATAATQIGAAPVAADTAVMAPVHAGPTAGHQPDEDERIRKRSAAWPVLLVLALVAVAVVAIVLIARATGEDDEPTDEPSETPSQTQRSETPTEEPTSEAPTSEAPTSEAPTETPSETPTETPTETPSETPTETPSETPTETPSETPTESAAATRTETPTPSAASSEARSSVDE